MPPKVLSFALQVGPDQAQKRLDTLLPEGFPGLTRSQIKNRLQSLECNGRTVKISYKVKEGDSIYAQLRPELGLNLIPYDFPLDILFQNSDFSVVNKPSGMVVHPGAGNHEKTLVQALLHPRNGGTELPEAWKHPQEFEDSKLSTEDESEENLILDTLRPGLVHRLDKETSGLIICARNMESLDFLSRQFQERRTVKWYCFLSRGRLGKKELELKNNLGRDPKNRQRFAIVERGGKEARSIFHEYMTSPQGSLILVQIFTGRTHQIRVQAKFLDCPVLGDSVYGKNETGNSRFFLHAYYLEITPPGQEKAQSFMAPLGTDFLQKAQDLGLQIVQADLSMYIAEHTKRSQ